MPRKRLIALILGAGLVISLIIAATSSGLGSPSVPDGDVAFVEDIEGGDITQQEFDMGIKQAAARQGVQKVPAADDPQYDALKQATMADLLLSRWVRGEAADQGIEVSDREVDKQLADIAKQQFGGQKQFEQFLRSSGFCTPEELKVKPLNCQAARDRVELQLITDRIQKEVLGTDPAVSDTEIQDYYDANAEQFKTPETRDVRVILNKDESKVQAAKDALTKDDSEQSWKQVAAKYSSDEATSNAGGLRQAVAQGQGEPEFDDQLFTAAPNQLVGPFSTSSGFYLIEVEKVSPAKTQSLADTTDQIRQTLVSAGQQRAAQEFQDDFLDKWQVRTVCAPDYVIDRCSGYTAPSQCSYQVPDGEDCGDAPVASTRPVAPGTGGVVGAGTPAQGLPQGPHGVASAAAPPPGGLPPGLAPGQPGGTPPGAGGVPQGGGPPAGAPQGGAPPAGGAPSGAPTP